MSIFNEDFVLNGQNGKTVTFSRPYLNDNKELTFLYCSDFSSTLEIALNEEKKALELRSKGRKTVMILLRGENESFFTKAMQVKELILEQLRKYTQLLKSGQEKIIAWETDVEELPFYFASTNILDNGSNSIKFERGLVYFVNEKTKKGSPSVIFTDFEELQKYLAKQFAKVNKERFKVEKNGEPLYEMTFGDLLSIA